MDHPKAVQTALINRRFAKAISGQVLADDPEGRHTLVTNVAAARVLVGDGNPMTLVLLAIGLIAAAIGLVTIGFGIPINAFSLGNTLIISGTIAVASGLILIGLALVLGQLRRIAEALKGKTVARGSFAAESFEAMAPASARMTPASTQPQMTEPPAAEPRAPEPRFPATASEPAPGPLDWLRAKAKPISAPMPSVAMPVPPISSPPPPPPVMAEPPMVELTDEAPLSPRPPQRPAMPPSVEPALEPKVWSPSRDTGSLEPRVAPRSEQPMPRATPQVEPPKEKERFDLVWPDRGAAPAPSEPKAEIKAEIKREPALDMPLPPIPVRPRETRVAPEKRMPEVPRRSTERGPAILKSGVIDGMPYTLYADGSIEAQLPHGTVRFGSITELRAHIENNS
jgi:hypothetical protein